MVSISIQLLVPITFTQHGGFMNREEKVVNAGGVDVYYSMAGSVMHLYFDVDLSGRSKKKGMV